MQTVILTGPLLESAITAAKLLKQSNSLVASATKQVEAAKEAIAAILKENREIDISTLKIGEMVQIKDVLLLEIGSQNKFAEKVFMLAEPEKYQAFKRDFAIKKFKSLV